MKKGGKFRKVNPQIQTVVQSWTRICETLMRAPDRWWQSADDEDDHNEEQEEYQTCPQEEEEGDDRVDPAQEDW